MNKLTKHLFSLILLSFGLSSAVHAQETVGPPIIRKEAQDGNNDEDNCELDINSNISQTIAVEIFLENLDILDTCNLNLGYQFNQSDLSYVELNNFTWSQQSDSSYIVSVDITFTYADIEGMCENGYDFYIGLYCQEDETYTLISFIEEEDYVTLCCQEDEETTTIKGSGSLINKIKIDPHRLDDKSTAGNNHLSATFQQYVIYDIQGNRVTTLEKQNNGVPIQQLIANLTIKSGIYFICTYDGNKIKTEKVYKH